MAHLWKYMALLRKCRGFFGAGVLVLHSLVWHAHSYAQHECFIPYTSRFHICEMTHLYAWLSKRDLSAIKKDLYSVKNAQYSKTTELLCITQSRMSLWDICSIKNDLSSIKRDLHSTKRDLYFIKKDLCSIQKPPAFKSTERIFRTQSRLSSCDICSIKKALNSIKRDIYPIKKYRYSIQIALLIHGRNSQ